MRASVAALLRFYLIHDCEWVGGACRLKAELIVIQ